MSMRSAMASVRIHAQNERLKRSIENVINKLSTLPDQPVRVSTRVAKFILLDYPTLIASGRYYSTQVKNVGAGVKELYLKEIL